MLLGPRGALVTTTRRTGSKQCLERTRDVVLGVAAPRVLEARPQRAVAVGRLALRDQGLPANPQQQRRAGPALLAGPLERGVSGVERGSHCTAPEVTQRDHAVDGRDLIGLAQPRAEHPGLAEVGKRLAELASRQRSATQQHRAEGQGARRAGREPHLRRRPDDHDGLVEIALHHEHLGSIRGVDCRVVLATDLPVGLLDLTHSSTASSHRPV